MILIATLKKMRHWLSQMFDIRIPSLKATTGGLEKLYKMIATT